MLKIKKAAHVLSFLILCGALSACSLAPDLRKPDTALPQNWQLSGESATRQEDLWWRSYHDEKLDDLVVQALAYNSDIQLAAARVDEARAIAGSARAQRMPNVSAGGGSIPRRSGRRNATG